MNSETIILLVDDDQVFLSMVTELLTLSGYQVLTAVDGQQALQVLTASPVQLILADVAMPRMNGYQLFAHVREHDHWSHIPFIFVSGRELDTDVQYGKELGADDYLLKSSSIDEIAATVRGKLQHASRPARHPRQAGADLLQVNSLRIDVGQHRVWLQETPIELSAREFKLLECLARHPRQIVPPQQLVEATHNIEADFVEAGTLVRPMIRSLRRKLGYPVGNLGCIENVRGVGYRLLPPL